MTDLEHVRTLLREWSAFYRDRARRGQCGSAERAWLSPQCWTAPEPRPAYDPRRAIQTQALLQKLPPPNHWAITVRYAWGPWLPPHIGYRYLSRRVGYRVTTVIFADLVLFGEQRVAVLIDGATPASTPAARAGTSAGSSRAASN